jgi:NAD(P)H-nitrite reductase large subunit
MLSPDLKERELLSQPDGCNLPSGRSHVQSNRSQHEDSDTKGPTVELDEDVCLCFHVSKRKLIQFVRVERPRRASQLSECGGAGTGCGWCRPFLERIFALQNGDQNEPPLPDSQAYAESRRRYIAAGKGTPPPGAEP